MMLWLILTLMTAAAAAYVAAPFLRPIDKTGAAQSSDLRIFKDQLAEIDREVAAGLIEPAAAEQARTEIKRRMLAADKAAANAGEVKPLTPLEYKFAFLAVTGFTVLGSVILYALTGSPSIPSGVPMGGGMAAQSGDAQPAMQATAPAAGGAPGLLDVDAAIAKLSARLKANPSDLQGWIMLGWSYVGTQKYPEAVEAYRKAVALDPKSAGAKEGLSNALIHVADGKVTPEALTLIDETLAIDPKQPGARFDKGLAKLQGGDAKGAIDDWIAQLKDASPDDTWAPEVRQRVVETAQKAGIDVSGRLPAAAPVATMGGEAAATAQPAAPAATAAAPGTPGPTAADVAAAQSMAPADRNAMIKGMVDRLAAKLEANPKNIDGWIQLIRSRKVLGDVDAAKAAFKRALTVFADASPEQGKLKAAAGELGIAE